MPEAAAIKKPLSLAKSAGTKEADISSLCGATLLGVINAHFSRIQAYPRRCLRSASPSCLPHTNSTRFSLPTKAHSLLPPHRIHTDIGSLQATEQQVLFLSHRFNFAYIITHFLCFVNSELRLNSAQKHKLSIVTNFLLFTRLFLRFFGCSLLTFC